MRKTRIVFGCLPLLLLTALNLQSEGIMLAPLARALPGVDAGELLLQELRCAQCHQEDDALRTWLNTPPAPRLGSQGLRLTSQYLRGLLNDPQSQKAGSTMPDCLQHLGTAAKAEAVDALVHFLVSSQGAEPAEAISANEFLIQQGRLVYHQVGCVACHAPQEPAAKVVRQQTAEASVAPVSVDLPKTSVPLGQLARKETVAELARYLSNPLQVRPDGRCPSLSLNKTEATAVAMYLMREQAGLSATGRPPARVAGLQYEYYEQGFNKATEMDNAKVMETGSVSKFDLSPRKRPDNVGLRFTGHIRVQQAGEYTFFTSSDDGTLLYVEGRLVVENDGHHSNTERSGPIKLEAGDHAIMLLWFNAGGPAELSVSYAGPGLKKQEIPSSALSHLGQPMIPLEQEEFTVDAAKASKGKVFFSSLGCASCHELSGQQMASLRPAPPLSALANKGERGCIGAASNNPAPRYALSDGQRRALAQTLSQPAGLAPLLSSSERIQRAMATFNCYACHSRDGKGGPEPGRTDYFTTTVELEMGDEGRFPPHLSGVGAKLKPDWCKEVLLNNGRARPYMATRMPQFGADNVGQLPAAFTESDQSKDQEPIQRADAKHGRRLVGTTGLSCITCHLFAGHASLGIPAMDLTLMSDRLQKSWFKRYLLDPAALRPGTRMPSFWPEGQAVNRDILEGKTDRQIEAIWAYLTMAKEAGLPAGLIQGQVELVVTNEAVIYRHWITGSGPRTIAVGYPERVNLAFDADSLRLAVIWQGPFFDAGRHRNGRGAGFEGPLGYNVIQLPQGPPLARLDNAQTVWPTQTGAAAGYRLLGYNLDEKRRPTFLYSFENVHVADSFRDMPGELDGSFRRTLIFNCPQPSGSLWFRAWTGSNISVQGGDTYLVDGKLTLRIQGAEALLRKNGGQTDLLIPIRFQNQSATIIEEIIW